MKCVMCLSGFPKSCLTGSCESNLNTEEDLHTKQDLSLTDQVELNESDINSKKSEVHDNVDEETSWRLQGRRSNVSSRSNKRDANLKDQQSTGRKRAARLYPLNRESPCEWQGKSNCGGGKSPILGCLSGLQQARHHGPDKSVSNNEEGNVHRICHACHNRWHSSNNTDYDWNSTTTISHNPKPMTNDEKSEAAMQHLKYLSTKQKRIKD